MFLDLHHHQAWYVYKHLSSHLCPAGKSSTAECSHAPKQPYTHPIQVFWLQLLKLFTFGPSLFSLQFPKFLQGWKNFNWVKTFHDVFSPIVSMFAFEIDCLRDRAVFTYPDTLLALQPEKVPENIFICSIQNRMLLLNDAFVQPQ